MPGRVEMGGAVGRQSDPFDRPAFAVGQVLLGEAGKELDHIGGRLPVREIVDLGPIARRIGGDVVLQRNRNVDQLAWHDVAPLADIFADGPLSTKDETKFTEVENAGLLGCAIEDQ